MAGAAAARGGPFRGLTREWLAEYIHRSGLFDPYAYAAHACLTGLTEPGLIRHYLAQTSRVSPQPHFDAERYRALAALAPDADPFVHFVVHGRERADGLREGFDASIYLQDNPDVRIAGWEATRHFVAAGWREDRLARPPSSSNATPDFTGLPARAQADAPDAVDVVVPVYRGRVETLTAIHRVLTASVAQPFRLLVIDDASPEPSLSADLARLEQRGLIARLVNPRNLGFTATANRGLSSGPGRDVVLLNADTEVYDGWLDRLRAHAYRSGDVGTVTPLSNAATILSYPIRLRDNLAPLELSHGELADLAGELAPEVVEIPTGVGFCLLIRRACLDDVGPFNEAAFPRGYGEENDFCRRAAALGWRNVAATDTFVKHLGSISFGLERSNLVAQGLRRIEADHPGYRAMIELFTKVDPLAAARLELDMARVRRAGHSGRLTHGAPTGGADQDLALRKFAGRGDLFYIHAPAAGNTPNLCAFNPLGAPEMAGHILEGLGVAEIVVYQPAIFGRRQLAALSRVALDKGVSFTVG